METKILERMVRVMQQPGGGHNWLAAMLGQWEAGKAKKRKAKVSKEELKAQSKQKSKKKSKRKMAAASRRKNRG